MAIIKTLLNTIVGFLIMKKRQWGICVNKYTLVKLYHVYLTGMNVLLTMPVVIRPLLINGG